MCKDGVLIGAVVIKCSLYELMSDVSRIITNQDDTYRLRQRVNILRLVLEISNSCLEVSFLRVQPIVSSS